MKKEIYAYIQNTLGIDEKEVIDDLWQEYLSAFQENLSKMESLLANKVGHNLYRTAHSLKGCAGNVGHTAVYEICLKMESAGREADFVLCQQLLEQLKKQYHALGK